jgi:predicted RNA-binding Zn ribbon-like protein
MSALYAPVTQAGDREPAPGRLALVQAFVNSFFDLDGEWGRDRFATPGHLAEWMAERGLEPGRVRNADAARAVRSRDALRALIAGSQARIALDAVVGFDIEGGAIAPRAVGSGLPCLLGLVLAAAYEAQLDGTWARLKICPGPDCGWVFYDRSRNRSGHWCSMDVCGGREKARAYRRRHR